MVIDMLTDNDLTKIDGLIEKRLKPIKNEVASLSQVMDEKMERRLSTFGKEVDEKMERRLSTFGKEVDEKMERRLSTFGREVDEKMEKRLKPIKDDVAHIRKDIKTMVGFFDREYLDLRKRVERIEGYLKLSVS